MVSELCYIRKTLEIDRPARLIVINSISLVMALAANIALLLNMTKRLSFAIAQSMTIIGFLLSSFLLIALVAVANTSAFRLLPHERHSLTQAFYYAIIAAGIYCIIAILMCSTVYGAYKGHYEKEFRLTMSQRTLMLQTIGFMMYLLLGALIFSKIEGWRFLDSVYWTDFTLLTIGIGDDFTPATHLGRSLLFPFAFGGIVTVGLVVGSIRSLILERGKKKMEARFTEKRRQKVLGRIGKRRTIRSGFKKYHFSEEGLSETQRREQEFNIMRKIQVGAASRRKWLALGLSTAAAMALWFLGAVVFMEAEKKQQWSYFTALYFAYTSLLTIGYGDLQPTSNSGKPFFVFWSLLAVPTLTILISNMGDTVVKGFSDLTIWAGSITILPGEHGPKATLRASFQKFAGGANLRATGDSRQRFRMGQPNGLDINRNSDDEEKSGEETNRIKDHTLDRLTGHLEAEQLKEADDADKAGDTTQRDLHFYHYVLARELRAVMKDVEVSPPKQYDYLEWAFFLRLIGQDEENPDLHRAPPIIGNNASEVADGPSRKKQLQNAGGADGGESHLKWSWLGTRSPLMGSKNEADFLLERLSTRLERELAALRKPEEQKPPPVSMRELKDWLAKQEKKENKAKSDESNSGKLSGDSV